MRCGFCNLFTRSRPNENIALSYIKSVEKQTKQLIDSVASFNIEIVAFGGGTPTQLSPPELRRLLILPERYFGRLLSSGPTSIETSPETCSDEHLKQIAEFGIDRISIGIQSFDQSELKALGRPLRVRDNESALDRIRRHQIPQLNVDLIYGIEGQTLNSWLSSIDRILTWIPEEIFLYPLYVRPLTGLGRRNKLPIVAHQNESLEPDHRAKMYTIGREKLLSAGYEQLSMRSFRLKKLKQKPTPYRCQSDAMIGLGCGARSYAEHLHYSSEWAVGAPSIQAILETWVKKDDFTWAEYGFELDNNEKQRRHILQSILHASGLDKIWFKQRFGCDVLDVMPELAQLISQQLLEVTGNNIRLTDEGYGWSDAIGPTLYSTHVQKYMAGFELK